MWRAHHEIRPGQQLIWRWARVRVDGNGRAPQSRLDLARREDGIERIDVAHLVAQDDDPTRLMPRDEQLDGFSLAAGEAWPQVDDRASAIWREAVVVESLAGLDRADGLEHRRSSSRDIGGLPDVERDRRSLSLDEQPRRAAKLRSHADRQDLGGRVLAGERGIALGAQHRHPTVTRERRALEAVVAEVFHAPDPHPGGDVGDDPTREDDDHEAARPVGRETREGAQRALTERLDDRSSGVAGATREGPVEVGDHEKRRRGCDQGPDGGVDSRRRRNRERLGRTRVRSQRPPVDQGVTVGLGAIVADGDAAGDADATAVGDAEGTGEAASDGCGGAVAEGTGEATGDGCGGAVAEGTGAGANAMIPPKTSAPARMPVMRPAMIDSRGDISAGGYQYERPGTSSDVPR